eukprot:COSAG01_NODE_2167_length_8252_cov_3.073961_4_plen_72_part_01
MPSLNVEILQAISYGEILGSRGSVLGSLHDSGERHDSGELRSQQPAAVLKKALLFCSYVLTQNRRAFFPSCF